MTILRSFLLLIFVVTQSSVLGYPVAELPEWSGNNVIDLSYPFDERTVYWPTFAKEHFRLAPLRPLKDEYGFIFRSHKYSAAEHGGTHMDAPFQRTTNGYDPSNLPMDQLAGPAVVIDITSKASMNPDYRLNVDDIKDYESAYGRIPDGAFVFLHSGWQKYWPDPYALFKTNNFEDKKSYHFPSFHKNATEFLIFHRNVRGIGVDTPSTDFGQQFSVPETPEATHRMLADNNRIGLEFIANLDRMPPKGAFVIVLPMKIVGGSGSPTRVVGLLPTHK